MLYSLRFRISRDCLAAILGLVNRSERLGFRRFVLRILGEVLIQRVFDFIEGRYAAAAWQRRITIMSRPSAAQLERARRLLAHEGASSRSARPCATAAG